MVTALAPDGSRSRLPSATGSNDETRPKPTPAAHAASHMFRMAQATEARSMPGNVHLPNTWRSRLSISAATSAFPQPGRRSTSSLMKSPSRSPGASSVRKLSASPRVHMSRRSRASLIRKKRHGCIDVSSDILQVHVATLGVVATSGTTTRQHVWECRASGTNGNTMSLRIKCCDLRGPALTWTRAKQFASRFIRECGLRKFFGFRSGRRLSGLLTPRTGCRVLCQYSLALQPAREVSSKQRQRSQFNERSSERGEIWKCRICTSVTCGIVRRVRR